MHDIPIYIKIFQFLFRAHTRKKYLKKLEHSQNMLEYLKSGRGRTYLYTNINTAIGKYSLYVNHFMNSMIEVFLCIEQICLKAVICFLQFNIRLHFFKLYVVHCRIMKILCTERWEMSIRVLFWMVHLQ